ncbi:GNAT family N-acetyltransferase [Parerythrobacter aestuarii]|uniref:GNAT family N-acetyltransferase n=1 Tax=Parerythrobacter aestuarii TaxID=3020909 RepID=UPI0024DEF9BF|nr:GNAT family N-acetyltransferase [Parerythrobacter aestuarii]
MTPDDITLGDGLTRVLQPEADQLGDITTDAFTNDPFNRWLFGNTKAMGTAFKGLARHLYAPRGFCYRIGDEGAAMWMLPGGNSDLPLAAMPTVLLAGLRSSRGGFRRINRTVEAMESHHPSYDHAYLFTIGVRQRAQGKGLGRKLIQPVLDACDDARVPAYLENSNPDNRGFYGSCGFERVQMIHSVEGSPPLEAMVRQPR